MENSHALILVLLLPQSPLLIQFSFETHIIFRSSPCLNFKNNENLPGRRVFDKKNLYLSKGYGARRPLREFPDKGWKRGSIDSLADTSAAALKF